MEDDVWLGEDVEEGGGGSCCFAVNDLILSRHCSVSLSIFSTSILPISVSVIGREKKDLDKRKIYTGKEPEIKLGNE